MAWRLKLSSSAIKSLKSMRIKEQEKIKKALRTFLIHLEESKLPFQKLNIRKLRGKWEGFLRIRIGKNIRIVLRIDKTKKEVYVYEIDYRGRIYK